MKVKRIISIGIGLVVLACASANNLSNLNVEARAAVRLGAILPDGKVEASAGIAKGTWHGPIYGAELAVDFRPDWRALHEWNDASIGVAVSYWNFANKTLGQSVAPYAYLNVPLVRIPHFVLGIRAGFGLSFNTKTYYNTVPEDQIYTSLNIPGVNQSIGSVTNFYFPEVLYMDFPLRDGWSISIGGGWYHMSNGSMKQPNSGYNIFAAEVGARYTPPINTPPAEPWIKKEDSRPKKWELAFSLLGAARQVYYIDQKTFFCAEMQAAAYWRAHNIFRLGGGVDVFYDGAYKPRPTKFGKTNLALANPNGADCWRIGVSIQPEFVIGHFTAGFHFGAYVYDPVKNLESMTNEEKATLASSRLNRPVFYKYDYFKAGSPNYVDGWLYTQVVLRYHLPWHIYLQGTMKSHFSKVEFVCFGLGAWI